MIRTACKPGVEGFALRGRSDCVDGRASRLKFCSVEIRVGNVHQNILCPDRNVHRIIDHCVLLVIADIGDGLSVNIEFIVVPADLRPTPDIDHMAKSVLSGISFIIHCGYDCSGDCISLSDAVRTAEFDLNIGMTGTDGNSSGHTFNRYRISLDRSEGHRPVSFHGHFLIIGRIIIRDIEAVVRRLKESVPSFIPCRGLLSPVGHCDGDNGLIRDHKILIIGNESRNIIIAGLDRIDDTADVGALRVYVVGSARQSSCAGFVFRRGSDRVDRRAAGLQLCRVKFRVGDVHQDIGIAVFDLIH